MTAFIVSLTLCGGNLPNLAKRVKGLQFYSGGILVGKLLAKSTDMVYYRPTLCYALITDGFQEIQSEMRKRIAILLSNLFSPFVVGLVLIPLVSFQAAASVSDAIKWSLILTALSILPILLFVLYLVRRNRLDSAFANVGSKQRNRIYVLAVILAGVSCIILLSLEAPLLLLALFAAGFSATVIFMCVNLWWKISLHTAFITAAATLLFILYGFMALASIVLIPLVAWARIELGHHSLAEVVTGALLAASILAVVFYLFGLI